MNVQTCDAERVIVIPESCRFLIVGVVIIKPSAGKKCCLWVAIAAGFGVASVKVDRCAWSGPISIDCAVQGRVKRESERMSAEVVARGDSDRNSSPDFERWTKVWHTAIAPRRRERESTVEPLESRGHWK